MIRRWFLSHPSTVGETYFEHMEVASGFGVALLGAGLACMVHAVLPCLFERTGSRTIAALHQRLVIGRAARAASAGGDEALGGSAHAPTGSPQAPRPPCELNEAFTTASL